MHLVIQPIIRDNEGRGDDHVTNCWAIVLNRWQYLITEALMNRPSAPNGFFRVGGRLVDAISAHLLPKLTENENTLSIWTGGGTGRRCGDVTSLNETAAIFQRLFIGHKSNDAVKRGKWTIVYVLRGSLELKPELHSLTRLVRLIMQRIVLLL